MSVSVMNKGVVDGSGYVHGMSCISMIESPAEMCNGDRRFSFQDKVVAFGKEEVRGEKKVNPCTSSSSTSSIGKNSGLSSGKSAENSGDADEVQSPYKGPLDAMEALEEVLPIRRGISRFYNGKSKSFASLADTTTSTTSMKDLAKPENAYMRRRRNLLTSSLAWDKNRSSLLKSNGGGVSKKVNTTNRSSALALAVTMSSNNTNKCNAETLNPNFSATIAASSLLRNRPNPHLSSPQQNFSAWRSYSLADLQQCVPVVKASCTAATALDVKPSQS